MKLIFIDETNQGDKFSVSMLVIDSSKYSSFKEKYLKILEGNGWDHTSSREEFKGNRIFNDKNDNQKVSKDGRIKICTEIIEMLGGKGKNKLAIPAMTIYMLNTFPEEDRKNCQKFFFDAVPEMIKKTLTKQPKKNGKNTVAIFYDKFDISDKYKELNEKMREEIATILKEKDLCFFEEIIPYSSTNYTMGLTCADLLGYLHLKRDLATNEEYKENINAMLGKFDNLLKGYMYSIKNEET